MNQSIVLILVSCLFFFHVRGQDSTGLQPLHLSVHVAVGIFIGMVSITLCLLAYLKFCHAYVADGFDLATLHPNFNGLLQPSSGGIDRKTIESIPFFHFSALKGSKQGLECAVCISKFEDSDVLRLLPKCKHAFHMNCIDQWLERQSTCPLCRYKFDSRDLKSFTLSKSFRLSQNPSNLSEDPNIELFVERKQDDHVQGSSSRFNRGSSFRSSDRGKKQELLIQESEGCSEDDRKLLHKFKHKIIVSDVVIKSRWSDVSPSDFLSLNSEMLRAISSRRFSSMESKSRSFPIGLSASKEIEKVKEDLQRDDPSSSIPSASNDESNSSKKDHTEKRSVSEITIFPRYRQLDMKNQIPLAGNGGKEDRIRRLWLPIVRKTVQWFSGQERYLQRSENQRQGLNI